MPFESQLFVFMAGILSGELSPVHVKLFASALVRHTHDAESACLCSFVVHVFFDVVSL